VTEDSLGPGWVVALLVQVPAEPFAGGRLDEQWVLAVGPRRPGRRYRRIRLGHRLEETFEELI